ncbi:MAG: DUF839 domain-containing protein [Dermatophilaceae bacterium]
MHRTALAAAAAVTAALTAAAATTTATAAPVDMGPSTSTHPYILSANSRVATTSILTVGDTADNGYLMAGIPDGLGAFDNKDGSFTLLANHEISATLGSVRRHGGMGAFISRWTIDSASLKVRSGEDLIARLYSATPTGWTPAIGAALNLNRLCSADLADQAAFWRSYNRFGTQNRLFLDGEEGGTEGRAFAHVVTGPDAGSSYELSWLGKAAWENVVASPASKNKTVVVGLDDGQGGQVYVYVGKKSRVGNDVQRAGLVGGTLYGVKVDGVTTEVDATTLPPGTRFSLVPIPGAAAMTGAQLDAASVALGVTSFARPEDGSWSRAEKEDFFFNTTASITGVSRNWHLTFDDAVDVESGGEVRIAVAGPPSPAGGVLDAPGPRMMDNLTTTKDGRLLLQEDPGNQPYVAGIYEATPSDDHPVDPMRIMTFDPALFTPGLPGFITQDEESSGIIPAPFLGRDAYLLTAQVHKATDNPLTVEMGQLLLARIAKP